MSSAQMRTSLCEAQLAAQSELIERQQRQLQAMKQVHHRYLIWPAMFPFGKITLHEILTKRSILAEQNAITGAVEHERNGCFRTFHAWVSLCTHLCRVLLWSHKHWLLYSKVNIVCSCSARQRIRCRRSTKYSLHRVMLRSRQRYKCTVTCGATILLWKFAQ